MCSRVAAATLRGIPRESRKPTSYSTAPQWAVYRLRGEVLSPQVPGEGHVVDKDVTGCDTWFCHGFPRGLTFLNQTRFAS